MAQPRPAGTSTAQDRGDPAPSFPAAVGQVVVDVVVLDRGGRAVSGLSRDDFEIEDEGAQQAITAFEPVVSPSPPSIARPQGPAAPAAGPAPSDELTRAKGPPRTFALVFDDLSLTRPQGERGVALLQQLVASGTAGSDRVLLVTSSGAAAWAARTPEEREDLQAVLVRQRGRFVLDTAVERISDADAYRIHVEADQPTLQRVADRYLQAHVLPPETRGDFVTGTVRSNAAATYEKAARRVESTLSALERVALQLEAARGRKAIVLVSPGFFYAPVSPHYRRVLDACRRANAAIYFLDVAGIEAAPIGLTAQSGAPFKLPGAEERMSESQADQAGIMSAHYAQARDDTAGAVLLANDSGGAVATDLALGLRRIAEDSRAYYLLGYAPTNAAADGKYRRIAVRLASTSGGDRSGFTIRARKGYYAAGPASASPAAADPERELLSALASPVEHRDLPVRLSAYALEDSAASPGSVRCRAILEVDPAALELRDERGRSQGAVDAGFAAVTRDGGGDLTPVRKHADLKLLPETRAELLRRWYPLAHDFDLPPGVHQVRAAARDAATGRTGSVWLRLDVPAPGSFRISTPVVSDVFDADRQGYRHPRATARREFSVGSPVYLAFDIYGAALAPGTRTPAVTMGYRVERPDGGVALDVKAQPIAPVNPSRGRPFEGTGLDAAEAGPPRPVGGESPGTSSQSGGGVVPALHRFVGFELARAEPGEYRVVARVVDTVSDRELEIIEPFRVLPSPEPDAATEALRLGRGEGAVARPADPELQALLRLAGAYVVEYEKAFGDLVLEEEYRQRALGLAESAAWRRTRADLVFARLPGANPWGSFRDVFELNGHAVRDRDSRLERLFREDPGQAVDRAAAIAMESARYNIGTERTVNTPTMPLMFLHPDNQPRFSFDLRGKREGESVEVAFRETARPTLVRERPLARTAVRGRDLPAEGRFWLNPKRGTVVRSEVRFRWRPWADVATVTTTYRAEPRLALWVPVEMRERYEGESVLGGITEAVAIYSNYRRFGVIVREDAAQVAPSPLP